MQLRIEGREVVHQLRVVVAAVHEGQEEVRELRLDRYVLEHRLRSVSVSGERRLVLQ